MNKEIEELYNKIDGLNMIIDFQTLDIAKLKNKIDKAIDYLKHIDDFDIKDFVREDLLEILGDKDND